MSRAWGAGRERWPHLGLTYEAFASHVLHLRASGPSPSDTELESQASDLFLAAACLAGVPRALSTLDREVLAHVPGMVAAVDPSYAFGVEVAQSLRERLLCHPLERLRHYRGTGPLTRWVRVAAKRLAVDIKRQEGASLRREAHLPAALSARQPEWELVRRRYRQPLERALRAALDQLSSRDRLVLRLYLLRGDSMEAIGKMYQVHKATVARWIAAAQQAIVASVTARLGKELGLAPAELNSLVLDLWSQIEITLSSSP